MYKNITAERVRQVREFHKLSQGELAVRLGVSRRTVIRFEQRGAYLSTWRGGANGNTWAELAAAYDAACDNFGSPRRRRRSAARSCRRCHTVSV